jgi:riboflavin kinase/FMN adenylyltransferase
MTLDQKVEALGKAGIQGVAIVTFTHDLSRWQPEAFVKTVLVDWLRVAEVWVGADFLFGRDRSGNFSLLRALGGQYGYRAEKIDPVRYKEFVISSTRIRRLVAEGRVDEASALLGHHFYIDGAVVRGAGRGRELGVPTANVVSGNELIPPHGVYATTAIIDGVIHPSVTNIGLRPTFETTTKTTIEAHILGMNADLYDKQVRLGFVQRLRDERRFPDVDALKAQVEADVRRAARLFDRLSV